MQQQIASHVRRSRPFTTGDKWVASLASGTVFLILASPAIRIADFGGSAGKETERWIKAALYAVVIRLMLVKGKSYSGPPYYEAKNAIAVLAGVLFLIMSSPIVLGEDPTVSKLLVVTIVFIILTRILMR